jgi:hypothetical protein
MIYKLRTYFGGSLVLFVGIAVLESGSSHIVGYRGCLVICTLLYGESR